ncbi:hypothetical protein ACLOJK_003273 [Asimina triloba]
MEGKWWVETQSFRYLKDALAASTSLALKGKADRRQETQIQSPAPVMAAGLAATQNPCKYPRAVFLSASESAARLRAKFLEETPRSDKLCIIPRWNLILPQKKTLL